MKKKINVTLVVLWSLGIVFGGARDFHAQTKYQEATVNQYGTITYEHFRILESLDGAKAQETFVSLNQTFFISRSYTRGISTYYLLENKERQAMGYVQASSVTLAGEQPEGVKQPLVQRKTIHHVGYPIYANFDWEEKKQSEELLGQKVRIKGAYHHFNGTTYYEIEDEQQQLLGLLDQKATEEKHTAQAVSITPSVVDEPSKSVPKEEKDEETKDLVTNETTETLVPPMETRTATVRLSEDFRQHLMGGMARGANGRVQRDTTSSVTVSQPFQAMTFSSKQAFVDRLAQDAVILGREYNLYPSVMIAQAILESGYGASQLTQEANNFYGMKFTVGVDEGKFERYEIASDEVINGQRVLLPASFRKYATAKDSLEDYAKKIAEGVNWDPHFYRGTWRNVATTYQEATEALTGKYATDPQYAQKLNQIIEHWDLTQYD
ncbi:glucosaminidase domain-containing protein [Enterococcus sp. LJL98]